MTSRLCPLTPDQRARLHPLLHSEEGWIWLPAQADDLTEDDVAAVVAVCNPAALRDMAQAAFLLSEDTGRPARLIEARAQSGDAA